MTKRIEDMLDKKLAMDFFENMLALYDNIKLKEDMYDYLMYEDATQGWYLAMKNACEKNNKLPIVDYLDNLEWCDYDIVVDEITETFLGFVEEDDLRTAYYHYIGGGSDV